MSTTEIAKVESEVIPFDVPNSDLPVDVKQENMGIGNLGKDDCKTPTILLLQGLSPQLQNFPETARANQFWHTGMNVNLGEEFDFVPCLANKRVILFSPRNAEGGGGILAFSKNSRTWDTGGNSTFTIKIKGKKESLIWKTGKGVLESGLTKFGSFDSSDETSPPAAMESYEYLCYLPEHPELSPCVMRVAKTSLPNGKAFNTSLLTLVRANKPIWAIKVRAFVEEKSGGGNHWTVPNFKLLGFVPKNVWEITQKVAERYADYTIDYNEVQEEGAQNEDEIPY